MCYIKHVLEISETTGNPVVPLDNYNNGDLPDPSHFSFRVGGAGYARLGSSNLGTQLVSKKNTTAPVWRHFGFEQNRGLPLDTNRPKCRVCYQEVPAKDCNMTNLYSHIKNRHQEMHSQLLLAMPKGKTSATKSTTQQTLTGVWENTQAYPSSSREHKELTKAVTFFIAKDMFPISTVEKAGFKSMLARFNPRYKLPSRNYFSRVSYTSLGCRG